MQAGLRTRQAVEELHDSAAFFLIGDLLSRAEERAGDPQLRPSDLSPRGPFSPMQSGYFWCSVVCPRRWPIISRMFGRCGPDRIQPERPRPDEPVPEPPRRDDPDGPGVR